jgi:hypothetical protein
MPTAQIIRLDDYRAKRRSTADRMHEAMKRWQTATLAMDSSASFRASCDFYAALYERSADAVPDADAAQLPRSDACSD